MAGNEREDAQKHPDAEVEMKTTGPAGASPEVGKRRTGVGRSTLRWQDISIVVDEGAGMEGHLVGQLVQTTEQTHTRLDRGRLMKQSIPSRALRQKRQTSTGHKAPFGA